MLILTMSRGGFIAAAAGVAVLVAHARRPWPAHRVIVVACAAAILLGCALQIGAARRLTRSLPDSDASVGNRLMVWSAAPRMLVDAPTGWGLGNGGDAYTQWYQPLSNLEKYRSLVSTHLTKIVELGIIGGAVYIWLWFFLILGSLHIAHRLPSVAAVASAIVCHAVAAMFTNLERHPTAWGVPGICGILVIALIAIQYRNFGFSRVALFSGLASFCIIAALLLAAAFTSRDSLPITHSGTLTTVGKQNPSVLVAVDRKVLGLEYGKTFRKTLLRDPKLQQIVESEGISFVESALVPADLARRQIHRVLFSGSTARAALNPFQASITDVLLVNPALDPGTTMEPSWRFVFGEYFSSALKRQVLTSVPEPTAIAYGQGDYIPSWPALLQNAKVNVPR
jgi:hypothetical protein